MAAAAQKLIIAAAVNRLWKWKENATDMWTTYKWKICQGAEWGTKKKKKHRASKLQYRFITWQ